MITAVGAAGMAAAITVGGFALAGLDSAGEARDRMSALGQAASHAQEIEYFNADVSGWQTAYAWDARRIGPVAAVQADNGNRAGFLDISDKLRAELAKMPLEVLTSEEKALFDKINTGWDTFFTLDEQVSALYAQDTPKSTDAADALILGDSYNVYFELIDVTHQLRQSLEARTAAAGQAAVDRQADTTRTMVVAIVLGAIVLAEPLTPGLLLGFPLIIIGCWFAATGGRLRPSTPVPTAPA